MALQIILVTGTGMITLGKDSDPIITRPSKELMYDIKGSTLNVFEKMGNKYQILASEIVTDIQNGVPATLANEAAVRAYLDPIIGVVKTV